MSISSIFTLAVGLAVMYGLFAVLASTIQETLSGWLSIRASSLDARLRSMLADSNSEANLTWGGFRRLWTIVGLGNPPALSASSLLKSAQQTGVLTSASAGAKPSYISPDAFVTAITEAVRLKGIAAGGLDLIKQIEAGIAALPPGRSTNALTAFFKQANGDIDAFKKSLAGWFDEAMDRLNGIYTRWSRAFSFAFGLILAVSCNVDTLAVSGGLLGVSQAQQEKILDTAEKLKDHPDLSASDAINAIAELSLQIGRPESDKTSADWWFPRGPWSVIGWLLTALAISFGSHFWFDALNKLLDLRAAGPKPKADGTPAT